MRMIAGLILTAAGLAGCYMEGGRWWLAATFCGLGIMSLPQHGLYYRWAIRPVVWVRRRAVELVTVAGMILIAAGAVWIYPPAGLIVAGLMLVGDAYMARRIMTGRRSRRR